MYGNRGRRGNNRHNNNGKRMGVKNDSRQGRLYSGEQRGRPADRRSRNDGDGDTAMGNNATPSVHKVMITGFGEETKPEELQNFIVASSPNPIVFTLFALNEGKIVATVNSKKEALTLKNLSGMTYFSNPISIRLLDGSSQRDQPLRLPRHQQKSVLERFIVEHYNEETKVVDLASLSTHMPTVDVDFNSTSFMKTLFAIFVVKCREVQTLNCASNRIQTLTGFQTLYRTKELNIINFCFDSNDISGFEELVHLKKLKIKDLVLTNNPISTNTNEATYRSEVIKVFPDIGFLDCVKVKQAIEFDAPKYTLPAIQPNFFDNPARQQITAIFLKKYIDLFDSDRKKLGAIYTDQATFSMTANILSSKSKGNAYNSLNRNLLSVTESDRRIKNLKTNPSDIIRALEELPQTKHDFDTISADCFAFNVGPVTLLNMCVHGIFLEKTSNVKRVFNRTFLLAAVAEGSPLALEGWPGVIVNDQLNIRPYMQSKSGATPSAVRPGGLLATQTSQIQNILNGPARQSMSITPSTPTNIPPSTIIQTTPPISAAPPAASPLAMKQQMVIKLSSMTEMNLAFAEECLVQNSWNFDVAVQNFNQLKAENKLPPQAFNP